MALEKHIYGPDVLISPYTNRPIVAGETFEPSQIFWCAVCNLQLMAPIIALQHICGRPHKVRANKGLHNQNNAKRKSDPVGTLHEPANKKAKEALIKVEVHEAVNQKKKEKPAANEIMCDDCNLNFFSTTSAIQHFKGKKHASAIAAKLASKQKNDSQRGKGPAAAPQGHSFRKGNAATRGGFVDRGLSNSKEGVPVGGQYGQYIPTHDISSVNFQPVGKKMTTNNVGLLSDYFVNNMSTKNATPTVDIKPSIHFNQVHKNDFGMNQMDNLQGNNRDAFRMNSGGYNQYSKLKSDDLNKLINQRDNFPANPTDIRAPNYPRSDRPVNPPGNMQYDAQRNMDSFGGGFANQPALMNPSGPRRDFDNEQDKLSTPSNYSNYQTMKPTNIEYGNSAQKSLLPRENTYENNNPYLHQKNYTYNSPSSQKTSEEGNVSGGYNFSTSNNPPFAYNSNYNPPTTFGNSINNQTNRMISEARYQSGYSTNY